MIRIREMRAHDWRAFRELRLQALREAPYAYSSTLAQWQGDGDTEERWRGRLTDVPFNVIAHLDDAAAGIVSGTSPSPEGVVEIISLWVAPFARGRGVGDALIEAVVRWARGNRARAVALAVVPGNEPAIELYRRHGFASNGMRDGELAMILPLSARGSLDIMNT
jgi:ribosomal protein S18 acetylase RimI-like enzyme